MTEKAKSSLVRYIVPVFIFIFITILSLILAKIMWDSEEENAGAEFELLAIDTYNSISSEVDRYLSMINGLKSFFEASDYITHEEWDIYVDSIKKTEHFPGIKTLSFLHFVRKSELNDFIAKARTEVSPNFKITPEGEREKYFPIFYFTKFMESDLTYGMDHYAFAPRSNVITSAIETGDFKITTITEWLFNDPVHKTRRGLIIYAPVYKKAQPKETPEQRWNSVLGIVSCAIIPDMFFASLFKNISASFFDVEAYLGGGISDDTRLIGTIHENIKQGKPPKFKKIFEETLCGQPVIFIFKSTPEFEEHIQPTLPKVIVLSGGLIGLVLSLYVATQIRARHKAMWLLDEVKKSHDALETANALLAKQNKEKEELIKEIDYEKHMLDELMDNIPDAVYFKDINSRFLRFSKEFLRKVGFKSNEEILGKSDFDLFTEEHARQAFEDEQQIIKTGVPIVGKVEKETWRDGRVTYSLTTKMPYRDKDGKIIGTFGISKDITELKDAQEHLAREKEFLEITLASIGDAVISTDTEGRIVLMNRVAEKLTGWTKEEAVGKPLTDVFVIVNAETRIPAFNPVNKVLETGEISGLANNTVLISRKNTEHIISDSAAPIRASDGRTVGVVLVFRDVTEKHQRQSEMIKAARLEMLEKLASGLAHDFNNILTGIMGNISLLKTAADPHSEFQRHLDKAEKECLRARNITRQLLVFTKGGEPVKKTLDIIPVIKQAVELGIIGSSTIVNYDFPETSVYVDGDSTLLEQTFAHLISFSVETMKRKGSLFLSVSKVTIDKDSQKGLNPGEYVKIVLQDHSEGIPTELLPKLFEPYSMNAGLGGGLGLASSDLILRRLGGKIEVVSIPGKGNTFTIYLPASKTAEEAQKVAVVPHSKPRAKKILIMDNEESICDIAKTILDQEGYTVDITYDGLEAVEKYREAMESGMPYDLVILDYTVEGGMGGKETIVELKKIDQNVRAVISTGFSYDPVLSEFEKYGFIGSLQKPYNANELKEFVRQFFVD